MKVAIPVAVRPNFPKIAPIVKRMRESGIEPVLIHTNQHYDYWMSEAFFKDLDLDKARYNLRVGSGSVAEQIGKTMIRMERIFTKERFSAVYVHGDTNMVSASCLVAARLGLLTIHEEAGLRSKAKKRSEEINRKIGDYVSDYLFAPTANCKANLIREGVHPSKIYVTGNPIVDTIEWARPILKEMDNPLKDKRYFLATLHRPENVDTPKRFVRILKTLNKLNEIYKVSIYLGRHPRTERRLSEFRLESNLKNIKFLEQLSYLQFLKVVSCAEVVLTDSGTLQEETCTLHVPCVTLLSTTDRPESVRVGANILAHRSCGEIVRAVGVMLERNRTLWNNPFGDGRAAIRIVKLIERLCKSYKDTREGEN